MTQSEFAKDFPRHLGVELPQIADWFRRHPATAAAWWRELEPIPIRVAVDAMRAMRTGDTPKPQPADWDCFPAFVQTYHERSRAADLAKQQAEEDAQKALRSHAWRYVTETPGLGEVYRTGRLAAQDAKSAGMDPVAAFRAATADAFSQMPDDPRDGACRQCRGVGSVRVWGVGTMRDARAAVTGRLPADRIRWNEAWVSCTCDKAKSKWAKPSGKTFETRDLPQIDGDWVEVAAGQDALLDWARNWRPPNWNDFGEYGA